MGVPLRVLFIEDSEDDTALLVRELKRAGYETDYKRVDTPNSLKAVLAAGEGDLVISDFSMPLFSGTDALKLFRTIGSDGPFIFVSGTVGGETAGAALKEEGQG